MNTPTESCWVFVVDTDTYAGNFARPMVAYMTGAVGECGVGEDEAALVPLDIAARFEERMLGARDEHGVSRPASIWPTPGWSNDGHGKHTQGPGPWPAYLSVAAFFEERPTDEECEILAARARAYAAVATKRAHPGTITGFRLIHYEVTVTETTEWSRA